MRPLDESRDFDEPRKIDAIATVVMPLLALAAAFVTAFLSGCGNNLCTGTARAATTADAPPPRFAASSIRFVPDEGARRNAVHLRLAGMDLEQGRFALRVMGARPEAADALTFDPAVARLDRAAPAAGGAAKLYFTALRSGSTRVDWAAPADGTARAGGTLVVE